MTTLCYTVSDELRSLLYVHVASYNKGGSIFTMSELSHPGGPGVPSFSS